MHACIVLRNCIKLLVFQSIAWTASALCTNLECSKMRREHCIGCDMRHCTKTRLSSNGANRNKCSRSRSRSREVKAASELGDAALCHSVHSRDAYHVPFVRPFVRHTCHYRHSIRIRFCTWSAEDASRIFFFRPHRLITFTTFFAFGRCAAQVQYVRCTDSRFQYTCM